VKINFVTNIFENQDDDFKHPTLAPGSAEWSRDEDEKPQSLIFICPCGCRKVRSVPVAGDRAWQWDGNLESPTLTPSIKIIGECGWHGFLTNGEWRTC
jgi:hypothetical protein